MKIQSLAVIFVIIILPISIILSEYVQAQIDTLNLQTSYDSKLLDATYDAVMAFQKNTVNSTSSTITSSKIRDVEASANIFLNSIANNFNMSGNSKDAMQLYIPAVVYTLYDGYYIYSPYTNTLGETTVSGTSTYQNNEKIYGLKPYIYYSREYRHPTTGEKFTITYSLDNYISIQGIINGKVVNDSGYLITPGSWNSGKYREATIGTENLSEYIDKDNQYPYVKVNSVKYYLEGNKVFSYVENEKAYLSGTINQAGTSAYKLNEAHPFINNNSAQKYYDDATAFTNRVLNEYRLDGLQSSHATDWASLETQTITGATGETMRAGRQADYRIFGTAQNIEYPDSEFNQERRAVIRHAIEKNLSTAIANYNNYANNVSNNFQMPNLKEDEWDKIINNVSVISFLQGMNMGTKTYNGYAIVPNNKNLEAVPEDAIYLTTTDGEYHRVTDERLLLTGAGALTIKEGVINTDFERKSLADEYGNVNGYFYPKKENACYTCIVNQTSVSTVENIYTYLEGKGDLASKYYTALARERQNMYKVNNPIETY